MQIHKRNQSLSFLIKHIYREAHCVTTENVSSNQTDLQLRFVLINKDLESKVRRINLKLVPLNQLI